MSIILAGYEQVKFIDKLDISLIKMERTYQEMITDKQKALYVDNRENNCTQNIAAAKAGFSERTGRRIDNNRTYATNQSSVQIAPNKK
jgi:hypothetical protein